MYKNILLFVLFIALLGCSERDLAYYQANLDEAKTKNEECGADAKKAFMSSDKKQLKAISEDVECKAASKAFSEYKRKLAKLEREKYEEEIKKKREQEQEKFANEYEEHKSRLADINIEAFNAIQKECRGFFSPENTAKCKALADLRESRTNAEINALIKKYDGDKLAEFNKGRCKGIDYSEVYCRLSRDAMKKQKKDKVEYYLANRDELKSVFNDCQSKYVKLKKARKRDEARQHKNSFRCSTVAHAASKLKVFDFSKPIG